MLLLVFLKIQHYATDLKLRLQAKQPMAVVFETFNRENLSLHVDYLYRALLRDAFCMETIGIWYVGP